MLDYCTGNENGLYYFNSNWYENVDEEGITYKNGKKVRTTGFYVSSPEDIDILKINKNNFYIKAKKDCMWQNNNLLSNHVYRITFDILDRSSNDGEEYFMSKHDIDKLNDSMNKLASDLKQAVLD